MNIRMPVVSRDRARMRAAAREEIRLNRARRIPTMTACATGKSGAGGESRRIKRFLFPITSS